MHFNSLALQTVKHMFNRQNSPTFHSLDKVFKSIMQQFLEEVARYNLDDLSRMHKD
jgi:hypothetical protein